MKVYNIIPNAQCNRIQIYVSDDSNMAWNDCRKECYAYISFNYLVDYSDFGIFWALLLSMHNAIHGQMPIATKEEEQKLLMCKIPKENWSMQWQNKQCKAIRKSSLCISIKSAQSNNNCFLPHQQPTCRATCVAISYYALNVFHFIYDLILFSSDHKTRTRSHHAHLRIFRSFHSST